MQTLRRILRASVSPRTRSKSSNRLVQHLTDGPSGSGGLVHFLGLLTHGFFQVQEPNFVRAAVFPNPEPTTNQIAPRGTAARIERLSVDRTTISNRDWLDCFVRSADDTPATRPLW